LKTFFLSQKKFSNFQKNALGATWGVAPHPIQFRFFATQKRRNPCGISKLRATLKRFEKSGAKTFMGGYAAGESLGCDVCSRKALAFRI
jgi:hypothetical protein